MNTVNHDPQWMVLYTRYNFEKQLYKNLGMLGINSYLPTCKVVRQWKDRRKKLDVPLFPCYLFVQMDKLDISGILGLKGAIQFIKRDGKPATIGKQEIDKIKRLEQGSPEVSSECFDEGDFVQIEHGPFRGLEGKIVNVKGKLRLSVIVEVLNTCVLVDLSPNDVKTTTQELIYS